MKKRYTYIRKVLSNLKKEINKEKNSSRKSKILSCINKVNITYFIIILTDIILVIYSANKNIVNYVTVLNEDFFVSKTRYLLFGRNYINLFITIFFYLYICLISKFFLKRKITKKFLIWAFVILVILNLGLFLGFTKKIY